MPQTTLQTIMFQGLLAQWDFLEQAETVLQVQQSGAKVGLDFVVEAEEVLHTLHTEFLDKMAAVAEEAQDILEQDIFQQQEQLILVAAVEEQQIQEQQAQAVQDMQKLHIGHKENKKMAHFAELDSNNKVVRVIVVSNQDTADEHGAEVESIGIAYCKSLFGEETNWIQTSYNASFRRKYAGAEDIYDPLNDIFISPQRYPSWVLDENFNWTSPVPFPNDGKKYNWNEQTVNWDEVTE
jgi:hypothetical protein